MALRRVELLLVLTGTLMLGSVRGRGWERIHDSELTFYETGQWREPLSFTTDKDDFYKGKLFKESKSIAMDETTPEEDAFQEAEDDDYDDYNFEDENFDVEGFATIDTVDAVANLMRGKDSERSDGLDEFHVEFVNAPLRKWIGCSSSEGINVACEEDSFEITLPAGRLSGIQVLGFTNISVEDAPEYCGYQWIRHKNVLIVHFTGCNVREDVEDVYSLQLSIAISGQTRMFCVFCVEKTKLDAGQFTSTFEKSTKCIKSVPLKPLKCFHKTTAPQRATKTPPTVLPRNWFPTTSVSPATTNAPEKLKSRSKISSQQKPHNCAVDVEEQISCGHSGISPSDCEMKGCCVDMYTENCYYPLDECTADLHFVFAIRHDGAVVSVDPRKLVVLGSPLCKPVVVNNEVAIFKIKLGDCGVHSYTVGGMKIYLIEVQTVNALNLKYGIIARSDPLRIMIECRYSNPGNADTEPSIASVGYMVKTPTSNLPRSIISHGLYDVELKIAKDHTYSSYHPTYHQPLELLLGHPVHLELNLKSSKPDAVILVNYCLAYPRDAKNALVLIHEGCANSNDPTVSLLKVDNHPNNRHQKRFKVEAFQFMDQKTNEYLNEEIYFMCSTEVCVPSEKPCEQQCFDGKVPQGFTQTEYEHSGYEY